MRNVGGKAALAYIISCLALCGIFVLKGSVSMAKASRAQKLEKDAQNYATYQVLKLFMDDKVKTKDDMEREYQFAYMNYRAHN
jgi:hypothetical protein